MPTTMSATTSGTPTRWFANQQKWSGLPASACAGGVCNAPKTPLKWNDFGFTFGGPFVIPNVYNTESPRHSSSGRPSGSGFGPERRLPARRPRPACGTATSANATRNPAIYNSQISGCTVPTTRPRAALYPRRKWLGSRRQSSQTYFNTWIPMPQQWSGGLDQVPRRSAELEPATATR